MASVNKVHLLGHAGRDAEIRYMPDGKAVANFSLATSSKRKDKSGELIELTQWHRITCYERLAEIAGEYVKKGKPVYIEGSIKYGKFTNKDGVEQNTTDIIAIGLQLLGGASEAKATPSQPAPRKPVPQPASHGGSGFDDMDDDIPF